MTNSQNSSSNNTNTDEGNILREVVHKKKKYSKDIIVTSSGHTKYGRRKKKEDIFANSKKVQKKLCIISIILLVVALTIFAIFKIISLKGKNALLMSNKPINVTPVDDAQTDDDGNTIIYKGETYRFNKNLLSVVFLGVDNSVLDNSDQTGDRESGRADAIYIIAYDTVSHKCSMIPISRDTMVDVDLYSTDGTPVGIETSQISLSYGYGKNKETACANTLTSLSRLFYNLQFTNCIALNWDGIGPLSDAVGGVSLVALQDIKTEKSSIAKGDYVTLKGDDAWSYVKYRDISKLESNPERVERQKQFMGQFANNVILLTQANPSFLGDLFDTGKNYMYSTLDRSSAIYLGSEIISNLTSSNDVHIVDIGGEIKNDGVYAAFYPDETSLFEVLLRVFYLKDVEP
ncbi:MAG: LytR family transcriptional regulator [Lachnospiraceae bacterium]|nr:LytR family transcriptional regulator [Lachnospiraceae bacterium]